MNGRRKYENLTDDEIKAIANETKRLALEEIYSEIGKGVVKRLLWLFGLGGSGLTAYLTYKGFIK